MSAIPDKLVVCCACATMCVCLHSGAASAATRWWDCANGYWHVSTNWDGDILPQSGDTAVVDNGGTCQVEQSTSVGSLHIEPYGTSSHSFVIQSGGTLQVTSNTKVEEIGVRNAL